MKEKQQKVLRRDRVGTLKILLSALMVTLEGLILRNYRKTSKNDLNILFLPSSRDRPRAFETTCMFHLFVKSAVVCFVKVGVTVERELRYGVGLQCLRRF